MKLYIHLLNISLCQNNHIVVLDLVIFFMRLKLVQFVSIIFFNNLVSNIQVYIFIQEVSASLKFIHARQ